MLQAPKMKTTHLCKGRTGTIHGNYSNCLVDLQVQDQNFSRVQQQNVVTTWLMKAQLQTFVQGNTLLLCTARLAGSISRTAAGLHYSLNDTQLFKLLNYYFIHKRHYSFVSWERRGVGRQGKHAFYTAVNLLWAKHVINLHYITCSSTKGCWFWNE